VFNYLILAYLKAANSKAIRAHMFKPSTELGQTQPHTHPYFPRLLEMEGLSA